MRPDPSLKRGANAVVTPDPRHAQLFASIAFGVLAAVATDPTGWVVERMTIPHSGAAAGLTMEAKSLAGRKSTLAYRAGKWAGARVVPVPSCALCMIRRLLGAYAEQHASDLRQRAQHGRVTRRRAPVDADLGRSMNVT
jgi:hypothetical protein